MEICEIGCSTSATKKQMVENELSFLEGCFKDITTLKTNKEYLVRPRLICDGFTGVSVKEKQKEELELIRRIVKSSGMQDSLRCTCPENIKKVEKIKTLYNKELSTESSN